MVFGSRAHLAQDAVAKRSPLRNFLTRGFHALVYFVAGGRIRDTQCGFKVGAAEPAGELRGGGGDGHTCFEVGQVEEGKQQGLRG